MPETMKFKSLAATKRKSVDLSQFTPIRTGYLSEGQTMPLVLQPAADYVDLANWAQNNRAQIEKDLLQHGAILFRGFNLTSPSEFEKVAAAICGDTVHPVRGLANEERLRDAIRTGKQKGSYVFFDEIIKDAKKNQQIQINPESNWSKTPINWPCVKPLIVALFYLTTAVLGLDVAHDSGYFDEGPMRRSGQGWS